MELTAKTSVLLNLRLIQNKSLHPVPTGGSADPGSVSSLSEKNYHPQWGKQRLCIFGFDICCWCQAALLPNSRWPPQNSDYTKLAAALRHLSEVTRIVYFKRVGILTVLSEGHHIWCWSKVAPSRSSSVTGSKILIPIRSLWTQYYRLVIGMLCQYWRISCFVSLKIANSTGWIHL